MSLLRTPQVATSNGSGDYVKERSVDEVICLEEFVMLEFSINHICIIILNTPSLVKYDEGEIYFNCVPVAMS